MNQLRSHLMFIGLVLVLCCVAYPLLLWGVARAAFSDRTDGSFVTVKGSDGAERVVGSRQIAQPFTADEYFWPRPSAASYNGAAAGGSNWGANNPKLRDRVAQQIGAMIRYKPGSASAGSAASPRRPQQDVEDWFSAKPDRAADWSAEYGVAASNWAKTDLAKDVNGLQGNYILAWSKDHPEIVAEWKKSNPSKTDDPKPEDLVAGFFSGFAKSHPGKWPVTVEAKEADGTVVKRIEPGAPDAFVQAALFDMWLQDAANRSKVADLEPVPADMVTASGAGLDPHITVRNARSAYQLDRVAAKRAGTSRDLEKVKQDISELVRKQSFSPLSGLVGEPLVNVLELNVELDRQFPLSADSSRRP